MNPTEKRVIKLIGLLDQGLCDGCGSGTTPGDFCVQNAVCLAFGLDKPIDQDYNLSDYPDSCVHPDLISIGQSLNDRIVWKDDHDRAESLRAFAICQLGTNNMDMETILKHIPHDSLLLETLSDWFYESDRSSRDRTLEIIRLLVEAMIKAGTPGSKFLYLLGGKYSKPKTKRNNNAKRRKQSSKQTKAKEEIKETNPFPTTTTTAEPAIA